MIKNMEPRCKQRKRIILSILVALLLIFTGWTIWGNLTIQISRYDVTNEKIPASFEGYRIAQISDLHNASFGRNNSYLLDQLRSTRPDIIVLTGDVIDSKRLNVQVAVDFVKEAMKIAPCYYVTGNHEAWIGEDYDDMEEAFERSGVIVLHNESIDLKKGKESIQLIGADDPVFMGYPSDYPDTGECILRGLKDVKLKKGYKILLSHRPEAMDAYEKAGFDLVFTGHAHGGQFRIPFVGGLVAPDQGFFPKYDAGMKTQGDNTMIISRGIGNSIIPVRINNRPEIVVVTLHATIPQGRTGTTKR